MRRRPGAPGRIPVRAFRRGAGIQRAPGPHHGDEVSTSNGRLLAISAAWTHGVLASVSIGPDDAQLVAHSAGERNMERRRTTMTASDQPTTPAPWVELPRRGGKRYRKFSRLSDVTITSAIAKQVTTWDRETLETFFSRRLRLRPPIRARLHLYEAIPGTRLGHIVRSERAVQGRRRSRGSPGSGPVLLHPVTTEAAAVLFGEPGLAALPAQDAAASSPSSDAPLEGGELFYWIEPLRM